MGDKELKEIVAKHRKWRQGESGGERAYLRGAYLQGANLSNTILDGINWLAYTGIVPDHQGTARAYKVTNSQGEGIYRGGVNYLEADTFKVPKVDTDISRQCAEGIHLGTFAWCLDNKQTETNRLIMFSFNVKDAICPIDTDGKFRVSKCRKIGECDWKGNLIRGGSE